MKNRGDDGSVCVIQIVGVATVMYCSRTGTSICTITDCVVQHSAHLCLLYRDTFDTVNGTPQ
jgi:hypothetical protein